MRLPNLRGSALLRWLLDQGSRTAAGCLEWPHARDGEGYGRVYHAGATVLVHRLTCELVQEDAPPEVRHSCDNPPCYEPAHLLWGTRESNAADVVSRGRTARGARVAKPGASNGNSKLTEDVVQAIRSDTRRPREIANHYGVNLSTVGKIKRRETWSHLP